MTTSGTAPSQPSGAPRDRHVHPLRVAQVIRETAEATSFVLDVPDEFVDRYDYRSGQFLTFRVEVDGETHLRSYSMSSSPAVDERPQFTVKRVPGGTVSNWMNDTLAPGAVVTATPPTGKFVLGDGQGEVVAFAGGSGITPIFSIIKTVLATTERRARLLYANRGPDSVIFAAQLEAMAATYGDRLVVVHHYDVDGGPVQKHEVESFVGPVADDALFYICGPEPFMELVEGTLLGGGVHADRILVERFTPSETPQGEEPVPGTEAVKTQVTVRIGRRTVTAEHRPGTTLLQTARSMGLKPPSSCENGSCATCMARVEEGTAPMRNNEALDDDEVAEGWVLTCQAVPVGPTVRVVYE